MLSKIEALKSEISRLEAGTAEAVEQLRIKYLSKKGEISSLMNEFRTVPAEQKRELGQKLNELKTIATEKLAALREALSGQRRSREIAYRPDAHRHPAASRHKASALIGEKRDYRHLRQYGFHHRRRSGD